MYADHVPVIAAAMRADQSTFCRGIMFAILSARVPFNRMSHQCAELKRNGQAAQCLWGWKFDAYAYLTDHAPSLFGEVSTQSDTERALHTLCAIPGLGIVKGAFVLQMLGHDIACLDARNIITDGRTIETYRSRKERPKTMARKIAAYIEDTQGKAQFYWDRWCTEVAASYGQTPDQISAAHLRAIVPPRLRHLTMAVPLASSDMPF